MTNALKNVNSKVAAQTEQARPDQVQNNAGGFVFAVTDKTRLERFLILGTDGGTYYVNEQKLTSQNVNFLKDLIKRDENLVLTTLVDVSINGRAFRNSPALFALALLFVEGQNKAAARAALPKVARTSTHLFEFAQYIENLGGWGRSKRGAIADWYENKTVNDLAYQMVKYRQRDGWTHRDLLRLSHPKAVDSALVNFALGKAHETTVPLISGFEEIQKAGSVDDVLSTLTSIPNLPWETIPTQFLSDPKVWKSLFYNGQIQGQALVRNVLRLSRNGAFEDLRFAADYAAKLTDAEMIARTRLHPINYLNALVVYASGYKQKRGSFSEMETWSVSSVIKDALNEGFHLAFKFVEPANKRTFIGVDVSSSMRSPALGIDLSCAQVSGAIAMTIARTEPAYEIRGFTSSSGSRGDSGLTDLRISAKSSLSDAMQKVQLSNFGGTDCAAPMVWALKRKVEIDTFVVITDNETWAGKIQTFQALKDYRNKMGIDARLAVFGVSGTPFTIADPSDRGMMDFVGFDSNAPRALADFSAGRL